MTFRCPRFEEMARNRAAMQAIDDIANDLKRDFQCDCEYVPPMPTRGAVCNCTGCDCPCAPPRQFFQQEVCEPPSVMVCYKVPKQRSAKEKQTQMRNAGDPRTTKCLPFGNNANNHFNNNYNSSYGNNNNYNHNEGEEGVYRLTQSKSRELRASIMYVGCDCEKRNGLQDDCQRTECHGSPACLTRPYPICGPSEFANGKHLEKIWGPRAEALHRAQHEATLRQAGGAYPSSFDRGEEHQEPDYEYHCFPAGIKTAEVNTCCCQCR